MRMNEIRSNEELSDVRNMFVVEQVLIPFCVVHTFDLANICKVSVNLRHTCAHRTWQNEQTNIHNTHAN